MARKSQTKTDVTSHLSDIISLLTPEEKALFVDRLIIQHYKKNEEIYAEGTLPGYMYCLITGKVKVYKQGVGGRAQIVRVVRPVEYFGYRAGFSYQSYVTSAAAFEMSVIVKVPIALIVSLLQGNAALGWFFIQRLSANLGQADARTVSLTQKHIRGRLAESLLFLKESYGLEEDGSTLSIYLSREDLANLSNMTTSNAIRTLSAFADEKLIAIDGKKIKIINELSLEKISRIG